MPGTIDRLEIFAAGTWKPATGGSVTVTEQHLDEMVHAFHALEGTNIVKPHPPPIQAATLEEDEPVPGVGVPAGGGDRHRSDAFGVRRVCPQA